MKRVAILSDGNAPVASEMMTQLNAGNRYRVGRVPAELVGAPAAQLAEALSKEGVDLLIAEEYSGTLPEDFPVAVMTIRDGEDAAAATERLMSEYPDYGPEKHWAEVLGEEFSESRVAPPPVPEEAKAAGQKQPVGEEPSVLQEQSVPQGHPVPPQFGQAPQSGPQPGMHPGQAPANRPPMPDTCLLWSLLATILCCMIPGIVAIVYSTMVSSRYYTGDYAGAEKASRMAQIWIIVAIVFGCVTNVLYFPMMMLSGLANP